MSLPINSFIIIAEGKLNCKKKIKKISQIRRLDQIYKTKSKINAKKVRID
jgi:hypothetical protein